mmetsp:Transcript_92652/g.266446  ORF Transcript_92652/g.266446 Transcript_92652/m.266446 type:complete len:212 (-) Transcript_92652:941-1576(-)
MNNVVAKGAHLGIRPRRSVQANSQRPSNTSREAHAHNWVQHLRHHIPEDCTHNRPNEGFERKHERQQHGRPQNNPTQCRQFKSKVTALRVLFDPSNRLLQIPKLIAFDAIDAGQTLLEESDCAASLPQAERCHIGDACHSIEALAEDPSKGKSHQYFNASGQGEWASIGLEQGQGCVTLVQTHDISCPSTPPMQSVQQRNTDDDGGRDKEK